MPRPSHNTAQPAHVISATRASHNRPASVRIISHLTKWCISCETESLRATPHHPRDLGKELEGLIAGRIVASQRASVELSLPGPGTR